MKTTWKVTSLQKQDIDNLKDVAVFAGFTATATEGDKTASVSYSVNLLPPDVKSFTALNTVTEEQAVEWVKAGLNAPGKIGVAGVEAELAEKLAAQEPVVTAATLPWAQE
jgi:hypothetical protein